MLPNDRRYPQSFENTQTTSAFMSRVYMWMMAGIAITGVTAYVVAGNPAFVMQIMKNSFLFFGLVILQFAAVIALSAWVQRMSVGVAAFTFALYATLVGLTFSVFFLVYTMESLSSTFFVTAFAFAGLSLFGFTTKRDLGPIGAFCMIGLFGMIGIMLLGMFIPSMMSNSMQLAISAIGIIVFAGLTAYDTQRIKALQYNYTTNDMLTKGAIHGALILYLDFINLFISLLQFTGDRR